MNLAVFAPNTRFSITQLFVTIQAQTTSVEGAHKWVPTVKHVFCSFIKQYFPYVNYYKKKAIVP